MAMHGTFRLVVVGGRCSIYVFVLIFVHFDFLTPISHVVICYCDIICYCNIIWYCNIIKSNCIGDNMPTMRQRSRSNYVEPLVPSHVVGWVACFAIHVHSTSFVTWR